MVRYITLLNILRYNQQRRLCPCWTGSQVEEGALKLIVSLHTTILTRLPQLAKPPGDGLVGRVVRFLLDFSGLDFSAGSIAFSMLLHNSFLTVPIDERLFWHVVRLLIAALRICACSRFF